MATSIIQDQFEGQPAYTLESEGVRVIVLPRISGKIASVVDKSTGRELLWRNPFRGYREPIYGDSFDAYDISGWEDCLPHISEGPYPEWPWKDFPLPDHGEVWTLPWDSRVEDDALELSVHGVRLPYHFEKRVSVAHDAVRLDHRISNPTAFPMRYIWATHPLLNISPGMRIELPDDVRRVLIDSSIGWRLGQYLQELDWPVAEDAQGQQVELDLLGPPELGYADKLYTGRVNEGWCGLYDAGTRQAVAFTFDPAQLPFIGLWINQGGYPHGGPPTYNVGIEPTSGYPDALHVACERGVAPTIGPGEQREWWVELRFGEADSVQALLK